MAARVEPLLTVADLELMPDDNRYELIEGELIVSRASALTHQPVTANLFGSLWQYFAQNPIGEVLPPPGIIFDNHNSAIPDLVVGLNERRDAITAGERFIGAPDIVIELVSPGTENMRRDRVIKRQMYAKFGVNPYWVADPDERTVEVYTPQAGILELTATFTLSDTLTSWQLPGFACPVSRIFKL